MAARGKSGAVAPVSAGGCPCKYCRTAALPGGGGLPTGASAGHTFGPPAITFAPTGHTLWPADPNFPPELLHHMFPAAVVQMLATIRPVDSSERLLVVPATAVVREGNADFLFVRKPGGENRFVLKPVTLGGEAAGDRRSVTQGLRIGEQIVVDGAFHLNNERRRLALTSSGGQ